ncbi:glutaredoxin family protein [Mammaliicoccus stepanovicii]|uniref:Glutaredoxin-like domain (DUF836) n=1 Tax=Mammaliicoccus stepanovicii TaxID=643214 RepID=A0A239ZXD7_9STAP|nr:glutaredoxin family protein [Mammaliicoccus stepanovicii]PNZ79297.1 thioredoxin family protein [Mammaliicoccus stepanovicii]GGI39185.1 hypothetical protein GCM10010896_02120 [Mammaliicoccus stepanovicii]SNV75667.1 Glutaredoxin-like domain (DUF836) [Mammaliicoccus stepanovicii]
MKIQFYVGRNCTLCENARHQLLFFQESFERHVEIETINIEEDDQLMEEYMLRIPVVKYNSHIIQEGNIDFVTLLEEMSRFKS